MSFDESKIVSSNTVDCLEQFWGFGLPADYRDYLRSTNARLPDKTVFNFKGKKEGSTLHGFFGIREGYENLLMRSQEMGDRYMDTMLPIGYDVFGNKILLTVKGKDRNKVFFWDHEIESEDDEEPSYDNLTLIADSFTEFLESLYDDNDET